MDPRHSGAVQQDLFSSSSPDPQTPSPAAAQKLSPAYPARAAWGTAGSLRAWQAAALRAYRENNSRDFLAVATPGAGKTTFALRVAAELLQAGVVQRLTVVAPTEHLKTQWADAAARVGIMIDPHFRNSQGRHGSQFVGVAITYAQVAANPALHHNRTQAAPTLVVLDEIHHGGDALSWGDAIREAFQPARRRLALTGTPFRSDTAPIPFVEYEPDTDGIRRSRADYTYGYADALKDGVVRPVLFHAYSGDMRWRTRAGEEVAARLGEPLTKDMINQAWRTALDPHGEWIPAVMRAADERLTQVRAGVGDAGGLVIASDQATAREYAEILRTVSGEDPVVVLSDDPSASKNIERFNSGTQRWMVAVRMVSEGVDVPRLSVGVYATATATPLFFAQAVGRFVRARRRGETASIFLPSVPVLLELAAKLEEERDHALDRPQEGEPGIGDLLDDQALEQANREEQASQETLPGFAALEANAAFDKVLFDGGEFGFGGEVGSKQESDFLTLPGLLEVEEVTAHLTSRQAQHANRNRPNDVVDHRKLAELRKELNALVSAWARKSGTPHGIIHTRLREASGGAEVALATQAQLQERIATVRRWFLGQN